MPPSYLPGERLTIKIIKAAESQGQRVGYFDDATIIVCEDGSSMIGKEADVGPDVVQVRIGSVNSDSSKPSARNERDAKTG